MSITNNDLNIKQVTENRSTIEKFLINSYSNPFIKEPFPKDINIFLEFMEWIANYLCSIVKKSDKTPLISIIMPVYNRENIVMNAVNSVLSQTYENFELIIVDDASTDGTTELLKKIKHEKIHVYFHEQNKDCSGARNTGLKYAKGEYITYLDSDNIMCEKFLEANLGMCLKFPDADCIYSGQSRHPKYGSVAQTILFGSLNKSGLLNRNFVDANTIFHKKEVLDKIDGFDETLNREEDWDFILKILENYKVYSVPFLQSRYYTDVADNRMSELKQSNFKKIHKNNAKFYTNCTNLTKKVNIIIPIFHQPTNLQKCLNSILSLDLENNIKIMIINDSSKINLSELELGNNIIEIIESKTVKDFSDSLNQCIKRDEDDADILILSQDAKLTRGSLESMQKYSYALNKCGLISSQQIKRNSELIKKNFNYVNIGYWIDVTPFRYDDNIVEMPLFYDGDFLELKLAPFFCTYLKRDVIKKCKEFNFEFENGEDVMRQFSDFIRNKLKLKIFTVSNAKVLQYP